MLSKIQGPNFKSLSFPTKAKFSEEQFRAIENIKTYLGKDLDRNSYFVIPHKNPNYVKLYKLNGHKQGSRDSLDSYKSKELLGTFDEYQQFSRKKDSNLFGFLLIGLIGLGASLSCYISNLKTFCKQNIKPNAEQTVQIKKDSLNINKNTLKLLKK